MAEELTARTAETAIPALASAIARGQGAKGEFIPYDEYLKQRHEFVSAGLSGRQRLDQLLVAGATGALVLSVTFLEKIAPAPVAWSRPLLAAGWSVLLLSLAFAMIGYEASTRAFEEGVRGLDRHYEHGTPYQPDANRWDRRTRWCNQASLLSFFLGVLALVAFAFANVPFAE